MKVREMMALLYNANPEDIVVIVKPSPGNASPLDAIEEMKYEIETTWRGNVYIRELTDELRAKGFSEEDLYDGEDCIALWPVN